MTELNVLNLTNNEPPVLSALSRLHSGKIPGLKQSDILKVSI